MNCLECRELLQRRLDGETVASSELDAHLVSCGSCRGFQASAQRLLDGVRRLPSVMPPVGFSQRLTSRVLRDQVQRRRRFRVWVGIGIAAAVLLAIIVGNSNQRPEEKGNGNDIVKGTQKDPPAKTPSPNVTFDEVRNAVASLTDRVAKNTKENAQYLIVAANPLEPGPEPKKNDGLDYTKPFRDAGQGVTESIQPVTQSAQRAVNYFYRTIPVKK